MQTSRVALLTASPKRDTPESVGLGRNTNPRDFLPLTIHKNVSLANANVYAGWWDGKNRPQTRVELNASACDDGDGKKQKK